MKHANIMSERFKAEARSIENDVGCGADLLLFGA
jgi:hypothetical protein